jgi:hypothetical protein
MGAVAVATDFHYAFDFTCVPSAIQRCAGQASKTNFITKIMKLRATFNPKTDRINLIFDEAIQTTFAEASRTIATCFQSGTYALRRHPLDDQLEDDLAQDRG